MFEFIYSSVNDVSISAFCVTIARIRWWIFVLWMSSHSSHQDMGVGKLYWSVLAGMASGLLLGLILAPRKTDANRDRIHKAAKDFGEESKERFDGFIEGIAGRFLETKEPTLK